MPSPFSGFTQPAASPTKPQFGPGHAGHRAAHGQQGRPRGAHVADQPPVVAALAGVHVEQPAQRDVGRPAGRRQRADADVHLAVAEREHPAVAGQDLAVGAAQLQVRADPRVVRAVGLDVAADRHAVRGAAVPLATEHPAELGARAVRDDQPVAGHGEGLGCAGGTPRRTPARRRARRPPRGRRPAAAPRCPARPGGWCGRARCAGRRCRRRAGCRPARAGRAPGRSRARAGPSSRVRPASQSPRPSRRSSAIARGVRPSPHALSRGNVCLSASTTSRPARAAQARPRRSRPGRRRRRARRRAGTRRPRAASARTSSEVGGGGHVVDSPRHGDLYAAPGAVRAATLAPFG